MKSMLPKTLSPEASKRQLDDAVSTLRQQRNAELDALRQRKVGGTLKKKLVSNDGVIVGAPTGAAAELAQKQQEERRKELESTVGGKRNEIMKTMIGQDGKILGGVNDSIKAEMAQKQQEERRKELETTLGGKRNEIMKTMIGEDGKIIGASNSVTQKQQEERRKEMASTLGGKRNEIMKTMIGKDGKIIGSTSGTAAEMAQKRLAERKEELNQMVNGKKEVMDTVKKSIDSRNRNSKFVVKSLADFHKSQRVNQQGEVKKSQEAAQNLHSFRGSNEMLANEIRRRQQMFKAKKSSSFILSSTSYNEYYRNTGDEEYRGFVFPVHKEHGMLLLHSTRKRKKGPHFQLPGGRLDEPEFATASQMHDDPQEQLLLAAKIGAAREFFEEVGIDLRENLDRLQPSPLREEATLGEEGLPLLSNELDKRLYFYLELDDNDFLRTSKRGGLSSPMGKDGPDLQLKLSKEHSGFVFEKDPEKAAELVEKHSGGKGTEAIVMALSRDTAPITAPIEAEETPEQPPSTSPVSEPETPEPQKETTTSTNQFDMLKPSEGHLVTLDVEDIPEVGAVELSIQSPSEEELSEDESFLADFILTDLNERASSLDECVAAAAVTESTTIVETTNEDLFVMEMPKDLTPKERKSPFACFHCLFPPSQ